ncbi:MAG: transporter, partial [Tannerellaceae bacterium]|nr:transporter [Tannerellaceae bacterium]
NLANKNVEQWIMPAEGGEARLLTELFVCQGTINVNSWAPDSKRFAFVSYKVDK